MESKHEYRIFCSANVLVVKKITTNSFEEAVEIVKSESSIKINEIVRQSGTCAIDMKLSREANESIKEFQSYKPDQNEHKNYLDWGSE